MASWVRTLLVALLLIAAIALVFGKSVGFDLFWDDTMHLTTNANLNPPTWRGLVRFWTAPYEHLYIPVSYTVFWIETVLVGGNPEQGKWLYHLMTLLLHAGCVVTVFAILQRLSGGRMWPAIFGALLFAVHPIQTESVVWVSETRGLLASLFSLLSIWAFINFLGGTREGKGSGSIATNAGAIAGKDETAVDPWAWYTASIVLLMTALLSKPSAAATPVLIGVLAIGWYRRPVGRTLLQLAPMFLFVLLAALVSKAEQTNSYLPWVPPIYVRPIIALNAVAFYLGKLIAPISFGADYGHEPSWVLSQQWAYFVWLVPVALLVVLACLPDRRRWLVAGALLVAALLPVLGLIPFEFQRHSTVADRYFYLAMLAPALALTWLLPRRPRPVVYACVAIVLVLLGARSFFQAENWRTNEAFLTNTEWVNPNSAVASVNRGLLAENAGDLDKAIECYQIAMDDNPGLEEPYVNMSRVLLRAGRTDEGIAMLRDALKEDRIWPRAHAQLAGLLINEPRPSDTVLREAWHHASIAAEQDPTFPLPHIYLGRIEELRGNRWFEAAAHYKDAIAINPNELSALQNLARCCEILREPENAIQYYHRAIKVDPKHAPAWFNLGNAHKLASSMDSRDPDLNHPEEAIKAYRKVLELQPADVPAHINLAIHLADTVQAASEGEVDPQFRQTRVEEALRLLEYARQLEPWNARVYLNAAVILMNEDRPTGAIKKLNEGLSTLARENPQRRVIESYLNQVRTAALSDGDDQDLVEPVPTSVGTEDAPSSSTEEPATPPLSITQPLTVP